jgi:hypothetical protein
MSPHGIRPSIALWVAGAASVLISGLAAQGPGGPRPRDRVNGHDAAPSEVIVKYKTPKSAGERAAVNAMVDAEQDDDLGGGDGRIRHVKSRRFDAATLVAYFRGAHVFLCRDRVEQRRRKRTVERDQPANAVTVPIATM